MAAASSSSWHIHQSPLDLPPLPLAPLIYYRDHTDTAGKELIRAFVNVESCIDVEGTACRRRIPS